MTDADLLLADAITRGNTTDEEARFRARYFNLCMAQVLDRRAIMRAARASTLLIEYIQPTYLTKKGEKGAGSWTRWMIEQLFADSGVTDGVELDQLVLDRNFADIDQAVYRDVLARAIAWHLEKYSLDGIILDTALETSSVCDPWNVVKLVDEIQVAAGNRIVVFNFGDADTWMGRTSITASVAAVAKWHLVEVFYNPEKHNISQWARRVTFLEAYRNMGKKLILGIYDRGGARAKDCASLMRSLPGKVFWLYKSTIEVPDVRLCQVNPEIARGVE